MAILEERDKMVRLAQNAEKVDSPTTEERFLS